MSAQAAVAATPLLDAILPKLERGNSPDSKFPDHKGEYWSLCPFHADKHAGNFSVSERGYHCFACGAKGSLQDLAKKLGVEPLRCFSGDTPNIFSLTTYATAKHLPIDFLKGQGISERKYDGQPSLRVAYFDERRQEVAVRYRLALTGDRFRWAKGAKVLPYGLWWLKQAGEQGYVVIVEGESDAQTAWYYGIPALGLPGAETWTPEWAKYLKGLEVFVWQEPDEAGAKFVERIAQSVPDVRIITPPPGRKDISECHILGDDIPALMARLRAEAGSYRELRAAVTSAEAAEAKEKAAGLIDCPDILNEIWAACEDLGLVGEERNAKLLYLALTSRLDAKPVSVAVKGPSSGGKSFTVDTVMKLFPTDTYYMLTAMSDKVLAYGNEPLQHRFILLYEAAGLGSDFATYMLRSLLSEGRVRYEFVEKTQDGMRPRLIEREGPTGLLVTTTWAHLQFELETRMLSLAVRDDRAQTRSILDSLAGQANGREPKEVDLASFLALQEWLQKGEVCEVSIPYAHELASLVSDRAVRLRRDFGKVLALIRAHAILHQATREIDAHGRIVATIGDYAVVYELIGDVVSEGVQATVSPSIRETVAAVRKLGRDGEVPVTVTDLAKALALDKGAVSTRWRHAAADGYLVNHEDRKGKPAKLLPGEPLPEEEEGVLPSPAKLQNILCGPSLKNTSTAQQSDDDDEVPF